MNTKNLTSGEHCYQEWEKRRRARQLGVGRSGALIFSDDETRAIAKDSHGEWYSAYEVGKVFVHPNSEAFIVSWHGTLINYDSALKWLAKLPTELLV